MLRRIADHLWRFLARVDVAVVLLAIVLAVLFFGAFFPQWGVGRTTDPLLRANWDQLVRGRYGSLATPLTSLGAFGWFHTSAVLASAPRIWRSSPLTLRTRLIAPA